MSVVMFWTWWWPRSITESVNHRDPAAKL